MPMPDRIGGPPEEKKPALSITLISGKKRGMPDRIGGPPGDDEDTDSEEPISAEQARADAVDEIISTVTSMKPDRRRLDRALTAFCEAWYSERNEGSE